MTEELVFRIEQMEPCRVLGVELSMSVAENRTRELWSTFMPRLHELQGRLNEDVLSVNVYPSDYFERFDPHKSFQKRAVAEVEPGTTVPEGMHEFNLPGGRYAVFTHRGHSKDTSIFQRIYGEWIPCSGYDVDDRPHFERLGPKYNINSEDAEEEIWIPIKTRTR